MNTPESPLSPETLDELLSADIDGELAPAAADLGFTVEEARAALAAAPGATDRRLALMRARDAVAAGVPLSASVELRLVAAALDRSTDELRAARERPRRARQLLVAVGSAAAAAAVIAGVVALAATKAGQSSNSKASVATPLQDFGASPTHRAAAKARASVAFGDVSNPRTLGAEVQMRLAVAVTPLTPANLPPSVGGTGYAGATGGQGSASQDEAFGKNGPMGGSGPQGATGPVGATGLSGLPNLSAAAPAAPAGPMGPTGPQGARGVAYGLVGPQGVQGDEGIVGVAGSPGALSPVPTHARTAAPARAAEQTCTAAIRRRAGIVSAPVLSGTGTDRGLAAIVAVFPHGHGYVVYVLAASDCSLLSQQTLP